MDIDELLAEKTVNPESGPGAARPDGVDPESSSWLDAALLSYALEPADSTREVLTHPDHVRVD